MKLLWFFFVFCLYRDEVLSKATSPNKPEKVFYQLDKADELFKEFMVEFNKNYDAAELEHRRNVFVKNLIKLNEWNREQPDTVFGIGPFADLTSEEFLEIYGSVHGERSEDAIEFEPTGKAPDALDWRKKNIVTDVKDQGRCGSCYIFSSIGNIESQYAKKHSKLISLSEQQTLDCFSNGCQGGWPDELFRNLTGKKCMKESDYSYVGKQGKCRSDQSKGVVTVTGGKAINLKSEEDMKDALASYGPLSIVVSVQPTWATYKKGVMKPNADCVNSRYLHALLLVGYGTDNGTPYWIIKNSWGKKWGESGYLRLIRGQSACGMGKYAASATVA